MLFSKVENVEFFSRNLMSNQEKPDKLYKAYLSLASDATSTITTTVPTMTQQKQEQH